MTSFDPAPLDHESCPICTKYCTKLIYDYGLTAIIGNCVTLNVPSFHDK